jgi:hypothetical protein
MILVLIGLLILKAIVNRLINMGCETNVFTAPEGGKKVFRVKFGWTLTLFVVIAITWLIWGGYGPGKAVPLTAVEDTGVAKVVRDTPDPMTAVQKEADAEEKKPDMLRQLEENLDSKESADDIIHKAIQRYNPDGVVETK